MLSRSSSDTGGPASHGGLGTTRKWRDSMRNRISSFKAKEEWLSDTGSNDSLGLGLTNSKTSSSFSHDASDSSHRQLQYIVHRLRSGPSGLKDIDGAYELYNKHKERASLLCYTILEDEAKRNLPPTADQLPHKSSPPSSPNLYDQRSSFSGHSLTEVVTGSAGRSTYVSDAGLNAIREWKLHLETLAEWLKTNLTDTYKKFEHDATPDMIEAMFRDKKYRKDSVHRMRNASVTRVMSADPQFFPRYEIRFRNYERVKQELSDIQSLLQSGESGISPEREVHEFTISINGDAILEFANLHQDTTGSEPVLRFRVSSHMLAETSPIFACMFSGSSPSMFVHDDDNVHDLLPPPQTKYICRDGSEAKLFRMTQFETNKLHCLEILFHAAHMHNDRVPREVPFHQFVAIAECSMRYKCTSPLELVVEQRWLPQWMHQGADDMPDGMVAISYAFGLRQLFTRMSKIAILNLVDKADLQSKPWPQKMKDKIWAVRCAKVAQVYACCTNTIQEYIRQPSRNPVEDMQPVLPSNLRITHLSSNVSPKTTTLSSTPRCPKGSHWCDASNLGWMMLVYNEMNLLSHIMHPNALSHLAEPQQLFSKSLAQIVEALHRVPSPVSPIHPGGVCDPNPAFRAAINDIFNSVSGLTLYDISGKSHGWALSKHTQTEPQKRDTWGLHRMAINDQSVHSVATEFPESVRLKILSYISDLKALHHLAMTNRVFYETFKTHELYLMRNILRAERMRSLDHNVLPKSISNAEEKVPKEVSDVLKKQAREVEDDYTTIGGETEDEFDDGSSIAPSITTSLWNEMRWREERARSIDQALRRTPPSPAYISLSPSIPQAAGISTLITTSPLSPTIPSSPTPTTPRQTSPIIHTASPKPSVVHAEFIDPPLTDEEAKRILWPEPDPLPSAPRDGMREKFISGDVVEDKTLVVGEAKKILLRREGQT